MIDEILRNAPRDDKDRPILNDDYFMEHLKELPDDVRSDKGKISKKGGYLQCGVKGDSRTIELCHQGGQANAERWERMRTFKECILALLDSEYSEGVTYREKVVQALVERALEGNTRAIECLRDTCGEKPTTEVNMDIMTDADRVVMANVLKRLEEGKIA